jgi:hypothetical protein
MEPVIRTDTQSWRRSLPMCLAMGLGLMLPFSAGAAEDPLEYKVKAAFLLNFTKFVDWPADAFETPESPVAICFLGGSTLESALAQIVAGEVVNGRKVLVQRLKGAPGPKSCQVFFASAPAKEVIRLLPGLGPGVLSVGEGESFIRDGGMIAFVIDNRRVRFDIHQARAENAGLKLSSRLLNVARTVEK